jgi:uncharacterized protein YkwD
VRFGAGLWTERMRCDSRARFFHRTRRSLAMTRILLALAALALLTQCADDSARRLAAGQVSTSTADAGAAAQLISRHRAAHGLGPVSVDARLNQAALAQARAVAEAGTLSHGAFESRMASFGIGGAAAENLTAGSDTVGKAVARWTASPGHNGNLLMKEATRIGLAHADSPGQGYRHYWALVLAQ